MLKKLSVIAILVASISLLSSCGVGPVVKILKSYNDEPSRYWISFIKKNGINAINSDGETMLLQAVSSQDTELVKACIKSGANVNLTSTVNQFPIVLAVSIYQNHEIAELLLKAGATPQPQGREDPLEAAIRHKDIDMVKLLLKYKAKTDYQNSERSILNSSTPVEIIKLLDSAKFQPSIQDMLTIIDNCIQPYDDLGETEYLTYLKKYLSNPVYKKVKLSETETLLTNLYNRRLLSSDEISRALDVYKVFLDSGFECAPEGSSSILAQIESFQRTDMLSEFFTYFFDNGMNMNELYIYDYNGRTTLLAALMDSTIGTDNFDKSLDYYNKLIAQGADPNIPGDNRYTGAMMLKEAERYKR